MFSSQKPNLKSVSVTRQPSSENLQLSKKPVTLKNPPPPTIFAADPSNLAEILTTKLLRSSRSRIFEFGPPKFFITTQSQNFIEKSIEGEIQKSGF